MSVVISKYPEQLTNVNSNSISDVLSEQHCTAKEYMKLKSFKSRVVDDYMWGCRGADCNVMKSQPTVSDVELSSVITENDTGQRTKLRPWGNCQRERFSYCLNNECK